MDMILCTKIFEDILKVQKKSIDILKSTQKSLKLS